LAALRDCVNRCESELTLALKVRPESGPLDDKLSSTRAYKLLKFWDDIFYTVTGTPFDEQQYDQPWKPQLVNGGDPIDIYRAGWYYCRKSVQHDVTQAQQFVRSQWIHEASLKQQLDMLEEDGFETVNLTEETRGRRSA
jgi:hypothetical protein